jgi:hypothetical protein
LRIEIGDCGSRLAIADFAIADFAIGDFAIGDCGSRLATVDLGRLGEIPAGSFF